MRDKNFSKILIFGIFLFGLSLRLIGINWDQGFHLHPDERFLSMVLSEMTIPGSFFDYLNQATSQFNPANLGFDFYVYGVFPLTINKVIGFALKSDNFDLLTYQGRVLSAFADALIVLLIFYSVKLLEEGKFISKNVKFYAAFFYAVAVLPIQLSHFFAVDTFLNFFLFATFYFLLKNFKSSKIFYLILASILFGFAISSKVSAIYFAPLFIILICIKYLNLTSIKDIRKVISLDNSVRIARDLLILIITTYISVRLTDPYYFQNASILSFVMNENFLKSINTLNAFSNKDAWYPPAVQWVNKTKIVFSFSNIFFYGYGIVLTLIALLGFYRSIAKKNQILVAVLLWIILFFVYQSIQFSYTMRYYLIIYPYLAIFSAIGFVFITDKLGAKSKTILLILILIWPLSFMSIYLKPNTRVEASYWINNNLESGNTISTEHWDDPLPLNIPDGKKYNIVQLPVFDPDTENKFNNINTILNQSEYYVLSSNRAWASIPTVPERYPAMSKFYKDLLANKKSYKLYKEFKSTPSLRYLGIPIDFDDSGSEEAFTVYDHPDVLIFKKAN